MMDAEQLLRGLGASGNLKGFAYALYMIEQVRSDPKRLYPETAKHFNVTAEAVERNLRTVIRACWNRPNRELLEKVAGTHLHRQPTNGEFVDMTAAYLRRQAQP